MTRHMRLRKRLRTSLWRRKRQWKNRQGRRIMAIIHAGIAEHFADGHVHAGRECMRDQRQALGRRDG